MKSVRLHDKVFEQSLSHAEIVRQIKALAGKLNKRYGGGPPPLFLGVVNGAFMFVAELMKHIDFNCEVSFVKLASYGKGTASTGRVAELIGLNEDPAGRKVIVLEDVVETGNTLARIDRLLSERGAGEVCYATLFFKPEAYAKEIPVDYHALRMPNDFIVGFGLDYGGLGRNLKDIYTLVND